VIAFVVLGLLLLAGAGLFVSSRQRRLERVEAT
jgi:LPXTG-motif cell wall-anchored protein